MGQYEISYTDLKKLDHSSSSHHDSSEDSHHSGKSSFKRYGRSVTINITATIPLLSGAIPSGANVDLTPFAIAPNGEITRGIPTNIVPSSALITALNSVVIPRPLQGNYVIGYFVTLGTGSPTFPFNTIANFSGVLLNNPVGNHTQTVTLPVQTLFLASLEGSTDVLTITGNFPIVHMGLSSQN